MDTSYKIKRELDDKFKGKTEFSGADNFLIAKYLYENSEGSTLIATAFNENPNYGEKDLAKNFKGKKFTRITCSNYCNEETKNEVLENLKTIKPEIVIIPDNSDFSRLDGMFFKYSDKSHLSFISLHSPKGNKGVLLTGLEAKVFYSYYFMLKNIF